MGKIEGRGQIYPTWGDEVTVPRSFRQPMPQGIAH
jgi:hypothetical protein